MITVCHLLDETVGWEQRTAIGQLLDRLPRDRFRQVVAGTFGHMPPGTNTSAHSVYRIPPIGPAMLRGALLNRFLTKCNVDLVHAWGVNGPGMAAHRPFIYEMFDPQVAAKQAVWLETAMIYRRAFVACSSELVRRRLVENGIPPDRSAEVCAVIRPGVDFQRINQLRRQALREELGVSREQKLIIVPPDAARDGGQFEAFWTGSLVNHLDRNVRVIVPGKSRESRRIARFAATLPTENALVRDDRNFEELLVHSDALVAAGHDDASTTAIAWAMAAGVPVIAAATRANSELIAHKVGGLLFKPARAGSDAPAIARLLRDEGAQRKAKEVASGQAYEVFGLRRYVEQHAKLYENLLTGQAASAGMEDPARLG